MNEKQNNQEIIRRMRRKSLRKSLLNYGIVIAVFAIMQTLIATGHISSLLKGLLVPLCVYVIAALSLNLVVGISGELSLGHAGFMCIGAYTSAFFSNVVGNTMPDLPRFILAILVGAAFAGVFGILIGIPVLRLKGDYLAIVTLAFGEIIKNLLNVLYVGVDSHGLHFSTTSAMDLNMEPTGRQIVKGALGISGTPKNSTFTIGVILIIITLIVVQNLINSRSGRAIMSTRDNRIAAESIGIPVTKYKLMAFSVSASLAGVAGVLYAHNLATLNTKKFDYNTSILILVFVVLGGIGNMTGSMIAAVILTALPEMLRFLNNYRMLIYAIVLIVIMLFNWAPASLDFRSRMRERLWKKRGSDTEGGR